MDFDAIVIGGGPAGSTASFYLAQAGARALVLEKDQFPRFHIGESLLPYNRQLFEEMGLFGKLDQMGFPKKFGAQFHLGNGRKSLKLAFRNGAFTKESEAFQVERAVFDDILLRHAGEHGVNVLHGRTVKGFSNDNDRVKVIAQNPAGQLEEYKASFLVDASGRSNFTGNQEGLRSIHPKLKKVAIFGHFKNVVCDEGDRAGDTVIVRLANKWFWLIPVSSEKVSVGCVMDQKELAESKQPPAKVFETVWRATPAMCARMQNAELIKEIQVTSDFSYVNRRLVGNRVLRAGDAAGFMDPIFSAGVYLAMLSGRLAAKTILKVMQKPGEETKAFADYEKRVFRSMRFYWKMVEHFYTTPFMEIFLEPRERFHLASAVNAALAGEFNGGWKMRWRLELFFAIVRIQARFPLVPRIRFD